MAVKEIIMKGSRWCIGNEQSVHIWEDRWVPNPDSFRVISPRAPQSEAVMVSDLLGADKRSWDVAKVKSTLLLHEVKVVLGIPVSLCNENQIAPRVRTTKGLHRSSVRDNGILIKH